MSEEHAPLTEEAVRAFFADRSVATLRLPTEWFGRPYDNRHRLSAVQSEELTVQITLDDQHVLTATCDGPASRDGNVLTIPTSGGEWAWTESGGTARHTEHFGAGRIEFHAP